MVGIRRHRLHGNAVLEHIYIYMRAVQRHGGMLVAVVAVSLTLQGVRAVCRHPKNRRTTQRKAADASHDLSIAPAAQSPPPSDHTCKDL